MKSVIKTKKICKQYNKAIALNDVSICINKGDIYGLVGKNGAGKTTLLKIIMGIYRETSGHVEFLDDDSSLHLELVRRNIGYMSESDFYSYLNAYDNLDYYRRLKGISDRSEVNRVLNAVGLSNNNKKLSTFSLGMKQRLAFANAMLGNPSILILDEPINGLDPQGISDVRKIIYKLNQEQGVTFLISSHFLSELEMVATRFGFIHQGVLLEEIDKEELYKKTVQSLVIKVDNASRACLLLEQELNTTNYLVTKKNEIILYDFVSQADFIVETLVLNKLRVYNVQLNETSLEEYFLELVGDKKC